MQYVVNDFLTKIHVNCLVYISRISYYDHTQAHKNTYIINIVEVLEVFRITKFTMCKLMAKMSLHLWAICCFHRFYTQISQLVN